MRSDKKILPTFSNDYEAALFDNECLYWKIGPPLGKVSWKIPIEIIQFLAIKPSNLSRSADKAWEKLGILDLSIMD